MTGFTFNAQAVLERAHDRQTRPNRPNRPNPGDASGAGLGRFGRLGTVRASVPEISPEELACDLYEERAAIREYEGGQDRAEAEHAARMEADTAAGITWLDQWRREADDPHNPDNWANSPTERNLT